MPLHSTIPVRIRIEQPARLEREAAELARRLVEVLRDGSRITGLQVTAFVDGQIDTGAGCIFDVDDPVVVGGEGGGAPRGEGRGRRGAGTAAGGSAPPCTGSQFQDGQTSDTPPFLGFSPAFHTLGCLIDSDIHERHGCASRCSDDFPGCRE